MTITFHRFTWMYLLIHIPVIRKASPYHDVIMLHLSLRKTWSTDLWTMMHFFSPHDWNQNFNGPSYWHRFSQKAPARKDFLRNEFSPCNTVDHIYDGISLVFFSIAAFGTLQVMLFIIFWSAFVLHVLSSELSISSEYCLQNVREIQRWPVDSPHKGTATGNVSVRCRHNGLWQVLYIASHYNRNPRYISNHGIKMSAMPSQLKHQPRDCSLNRLFKVQIKENIKGPRHWPLWGKFAGDRRIPRTNGQ